MTMTTFQMLWIGMRSFRWLVRFCRPIAQSHKTFFDVLWGIYSQNAFLSLIIRINPFSHKSKTTSSKHKNGLFEIQHFHYSFLMWYFKMHIKAGWWKRGQFLKQPFSKKTWIIWITFFHYKKNVLQWCHIFKNHFVTFLLTIFSWYKEHFNKNLFPI